MHTEIGSFEAKTKLPELLRAVTRGHRYTITLRGKPIADLVPSDGRGIDDPVEAVAAMRTIQRIQGVPDEDVREWIAEGRR